MKKWQWIVTICLLVTNAIILICQRNWAALIWELGCAFYLYQTLRALNLAEGLKAVICDLGKRDLCRQMMEAEKKAECYLANCNKALKKMIMLKNLNKSLFRKIEELTKINLHQAEVIKNLKKKHNVE